MTRILPGLALAAVLLGLAALESQPLGGAETIAQGTATLGVDADPSGNRTTSLGTIDPCISVSTNDAFDVDVFITNVVDLLGWELYLVYDTSVLSIIDRDVQMFQAANIDSNVFDASEALPDVDGQYHLAAADIGEPPSPDSGSGVLARLTLRATGAGVSPVSLALIDINGDGTADLGPSLTDVKGGHIGDVDGDALFDGPISSAQIAVDTACPAGTPEAPPTPTPAAPRSGGAGVTSGGDGAPWTMPFLGGGLLALIMAGLILWRALQRRAT